MSSYAADFIKQKYEELDQSSDENYTTITIRLAPKDVLMLKVIAKGLSFPVSTAFTKILSMHAYDMVMGLHDDDFRDFLKKHYRYDELDSYWLKEMVSNEMLDRPKFPGFDLPGMDKP